MRASRLKNENGAAAVEFALIAPILLLLLVGTVEFGWFIHMKMTLNSAATYAARVVVNQLYSGNDPEELAETAVMEYLGRKYRTTIVKCVIVQTEHSPDDPKRITVYIVNWPHTSLTNMMPDMALPGSMSAKAVMAYE